LTEPIASPRFGSSPVGDGASACSCRAIAVSSAQLVNVAPPARRAREESR
jgi:hypothetical protein